MTGEWIGPTTITPHLVNIVIVVLVGWLVFEAAHGRGWLLLLYVAAFPFLYAAQPFSWYWQDGRYAVFLAPAAALALASLVCQVGAWADPVAAVRARRSWPRSCSSAAWD